jgi:hypothetical protein
MNIYQKLIEVRKAVKYLEKKNEGYEYKYVSSSQTLASVKSKMDELGLLLIPSVTDKNLTQDIYEKKYKDEIKRKVDYFTELEIDFTWVNAEKPEEQIVSHWYGQGLDTGEKGVGKALTYAEKYYLLKFFNIPTDKDDPDSFQEKIDGNNKNEVKKPEVKKDDDVELKKQLVKKHGGNTEKAKAEYEKIKKAEASEELEPEIEKYLEQSLIVEVKND